MAKVQDTALEIALEYINKLQEAGIKIDKAYLYGSYARNRATEDSDIDIAIVSPDLTGDRFEDALFLKRFRMSLDLRIEPLPIRPENFKEEDPIVSEILSHAIPISVD